VAAEPADSLFVSGRLVEVVQSAAGFGLVKVHQSDYFQSGQHSNTMHLGEWILRWRLNTGLLRGITFGKWLRLLGENRFSVDARYWPRAAVITGVSLFNSTAAVAERVLYQRSIDRAPIQPLLLILGAPRSGTTMLHQILAHDGRFAYPNFFNVYNPSTFLLTERILSRLLAPLLSGKRMQDNVSLTMDTPDETERATALLSVRAVDMAWYFHGREGHYGRYATFEEAGEAELRQWEEALLHFYRKLSWHHRRPLVVKSPFDMGRLRILTRLFPSARYVHICRHPYPVVQSTIRTYGMVRNLAPLRNDREPFTDQDLESMVVARYRRLTRNYLRDRDLIPPGHLAEIRYEDFIRDPLNHLERVYDELSLPDFGGVRETYRDYLATLRDYQTTRHPPIPDRLRDRINTECADCFEQWGYPMTTEPSGG